MSEKLHNPIGINKEHGKKKPEGWSENVERDEAMAYGGSLSREGAARRRAKNGEDDSFAPRLDEEADRREHWTGVLHDNPVDPLFMEDHPEVDFSAAGLADVEERIREIADAISLRKERVEKGFDDTPMEKILDQLNPKKIYDGTKNYSKELQAELREQKDSLEAWIADDNSTLKQLRAIYAEVKKIHLKATEDYGEELANLIDAVESGRTTEIVNRMYFSEPPKPTPPPLFQMPPPKV